MLDLAILGLLQEGDLHGYEIRRRMRDSLGLTANISFGSLYPALARLEASGAVTATERAAGVTALTSGAAMGSLSGELAALRARRASIARPKKSKKVYRITPAGQELFAELLAAPTSPDDARNFSLRLSFARHLTPDVRLALLQRRRAQLVDRLTEVSASARREELDVYARCVVEHTEDRVRHDIAWLDGLMAAESHRSTQHATSQDPSVDRSMAPPMSSPKG